MDNLINRRLVYDVIDDERDYQDNRWPGNNPLSETFGVTDGHTVGGSLLMIEEYCLRARKAWNDSLGDNETLHHLRKIAAIAVRAMEIHGAPRREGY